MKTTRLAMTIALAIFLGLSAHSLRAQTTQQIAEMNALSEKDWTDTLDYQDWLLNAQYWTEHSDSEYAKQFFAELNLSATDQDALRSIVSDFNKQHAQLMSDYYAKLDNPDWNSETQVKLIQALVHATKDAIQRIQTGLSADGVSRVDAAVLRSVLHSEAG